MLGRCKSAIHQKNINILLLSTTLFVPTELHFYKTIVRWNGIHIGHNGKLVWSGSAIWTLRLPILKRHEFLFVFIFFSVRQQIVSANIFFCLRLINKSQFSWSTKQQPVAQLALRTHQTMAVAVLLLHHIFWFGFGSRLSPLP